MTEPQGQNFLHQVESGWRLFKRDMVASMPLRITFLLALVAFVLALTVFLGLHA